MENIIIQIIIGVAAVLSAYFAHRTKKVAEETHEAVNSRMDTFLMMAQKMFKAEGVKEEREAEAGRKLQATRIEVTSEIKPESSGNTPL